MELNELRRKAQELIDLDTQLAAEYVPVWHEYIKASNPSAILALLSRLEQAEKDRVKLRNRLDAMRRQRDGYRNQLRKTEQQMQKVREVMAGWDTDEDAKGLYFDLERALDGDGRG